ncbi:MAG: hypothetical protein ABEJ07_01820 [Candidatus Nanohaloarchaea archaeon]
MGEITVTEFVFKEQEVELNTEVPVNVKGKVYEQMKERDGYTDYEELFDVYQWEKGRGHPPQLLFVDSNRPVRTGEQKLFLEKADYDDWELDERGEFVAKKILEGEDSPIAPECFTLGYPANPSDVRDFLSELDGEEIRELIDIYLKGAGAVELDDRLLFSLRPYLFRYDQDTIVPEQAMPSNPHAIIYTNPYVGKSTTFGRIGVKVDYATPAKVLGWSGAEKNETGTLHDMTEALGIDELNEGNSDGNLLSRGFLPLMRDGNYKAAQGQGVATRTWAPLVFMSNPKESETSDDLVTRFRDNLSKLSDNYGALGSRIGLIQYGEDFEPVQDKAGDRERHQNAGKVVKTIFQLAAEPFSRLVKEEEVQKWLNQGFPERYEEEIKKRADEDIALTEVRKFWLEHLKAGKHARGHALRNACIDHLSSLVAEEYDVEEILETADDYFSRLTDENRESFRNISSMIDQSKLESVARKDLAGLEPVYMRLFAYGVISKHQKNPLDEGEFYPLNHVRESFLAIKDDIVTDDMAKQYRKFARIRTHIEGSAGSKREMLRSLLGIEISDVEGETMFRVSDLQKFDQYVKADVLSVPNVPDSAESTSGTSSTSVPTGVLQKVKELVPEEGEGEEEQYIIEEIQEEHDLDPEKTQDYLDMLKQEGEIFHTKPGKVKRL